MKLSAISPALAAAALLLSCAAALSADLAPGSAGREAYVRRARSYPPVIAYEYPRYRVRYIDHTHDEYCDEVRDENPQCRYVGSF